MYRMATSKELQKYLIRYSDLFMTDLIIRTKVLNSKRLRSYSHLLTVLVLINFGCGQPEPPGYDQEQLDWRENRLKEIKGPYAWPSVVGLYPLDKSLIYFGKSPSNEILLQGPAPSSFGSLQIYEDSVVMDSYKNLSVHVNGIPKARARLLTDMDEEGPTKASYKSLEWYIIKRQDKHFLRVKDTMSTFRTNLSSIPYFDIDETYKVKAQFIAADSNDRITYKNILGMDFNVSYAGTLEFTINGQKQSLRALHSDDDTYFVIFSDMTTGEETYGGGRYLYPKKADEFGETWLDFNTAINPPCVFTPYATCPLPPKGNHLDIRVAAGEKYLKLF